MAERSAIPTILLEAGTHWWCTCGRSGHLPFCDGSHRGSGLQPRRLDLAGPVRLSWSSAAHPPEPPLPP